MRNSTMEYKVNQAYEELKRLIQWHSDCIYVLQKGNIVARGTDKQLKEQCKLYRQLYGEEEK